MPPLIETAGECRCHRDFGRSGKRSHVLRACTRLAQHAQRLGLGVMAVHAAIETIGLLNNQIADVQRQRLAAIDRQIADLERRRTRLIKTLSEGAVPPVD